MKRIAVTLPSVLFTQAALATHDLSCAGQEYEVYMGVGVAEHGTGSVGHVTITDKQSGTSLQFHSEQVRTNKLMWIDAQGDYARNVLDVYLTKEDGTLIRITATARDGALRSGAASYVVDCDWER